MLLENLLDSFAPLGNTFPVGSKYYLFFYFYIMAELSKNAEKVLELVEGLTIVELADLVSAMEEKFGVSAAAPVAVMAAGAGAAGGEEEKTSFDVVMTSAGAQKIAVIKVIREITGLGLAEAKALADNGGDIKKGVKKDEADKIKKQLEESGATVELK
jgi:large subunit ribosomal protein L7/L12